MSIFHAVMWQDIDLTSVSSIKIKKLFSYIENCTINLIVRISNSPGDPNSWIYLYNEPQITYDTSEVQIILPISGYLGVYTMEVGADITYQGPDSYSITLDIYEIIFDSGKLSGSPSISLTPGRRGLGTLTSGGMNAWGP